MTSWRERGTKIIFFVKGQILLLVSDIAVNQFTSKKGISDSFLPKGVAKGCFTIGSTLIYFVPSMNKYVIKDSVGSDGLITRWDIPPNSDTYDEQVLHNINVGAVTILVIAVAMFYLIKKMKR